VTETADPRRRTLLVVLLVPLVLGGLRVAQLLSYAPALYDGEFLYFGGLANEIADQGSIGPSLSMGIKRLCYDPVQTGTMFIQVASGLLSLVMGATAWNMHALAILCEMSAAAVLAWLLLRVGGLRAVLLGALPWLLQPGPAVTWQLRPYGNHTEFLVIPLAVAAFLVARSPKERPAWHWLAPLALLTVGVTLYRLEVTAVAALLGACMLSRERRSIALAAATSVGALVAATLIAMGTCGHLIGPRFPASTLDPGQLFANLVLVPSYFPAPALHGLRVPFLVLVTAALLLAIGVSVWAATTRRPQRALWFATLWAVMNLGLAIPDGNPQLSHQLNTLFAILLAVGLLQATDLPRRVRASASVLAVALALTCLPDAAALVRPSAWERNSSYDGARIFRYLQLPMIDPDDSPRLHQMLDAGRLDTYAEHSFNFPPMRCGPGDLHDWKNSPLVDPIAGRCDCWEPGGLTDALAQDARDKPDLDPAPLGRILWVLCNRDVPALEAAMEGLDPQVAGPLLDAARDEATR